MELLAKFFVSVVIFIAMLKSAAFGYYLGSTEIISVLLAAMHFALDGFKVSLAPIVARTWSDPDRNHGQAVAGTILMAVLVIWGFGSAFGIAAKARLETSGSRASVNQSYALTQSEIKRLEAATATPTPRKVGEIDADLTTLKAKRVEGKSVQAHVGDCTSLTSFTARKYCPEIARLTAERQTSEKWFKDEAELARLRGSESAFKQHTSVDPQADIIARLFGTSLDTVQIALMVAFGVIIELVSSLGLIAASTPHPTRGSERKPVAQSSPNVVHVAPTATTVSAPPAVEVPPAPPSKPKRKAAKVRKLRKVRRPPKEVRIPKPVLRRPTVAKPLVLRPANRNKR